MSVADQTPVAGYVGNGVTTAFTFPFTILAEGDVSVMVAGLLLTLNVHYTVSGVGGASGTVTFTSAPASLASIVIYRDSDLTRDTDYQDNGDLLAATLNRDLDRLWLCMQEILAGSKTNPRTVRAPIGETLVDLPAAAARAGNLLGFDSVTGQPIAVAPNSQDASALALKLASNASGDGASTIGVEDVQAIELQQLTVTAATEINVLRYMPPSEWAGILAGTSTYDARVAFQSAINTSRPLYAPGIYKIVGSLDFTSLSTLRGDGTNGGSTAGSGCIFFNTGADPSVTVTNPKGRSFSHVQDFFFKASSWDATTGANGHGIDIAGHLSLSRVQVIGFKKLGIYLHHDATQNGPYESTFTNVKSVYNGQHGICVGRGANVVTLIDCEAKWNGAPAWLTAPSVLGTYDGVYVDNYDDGSGYPTYNPEALTIIGGDCSYNSRYGWNLLSVSYGNLAPMYAEFNLAAHDCNIGQIQNCLVQIGRIPAAKVNLAQTFAAYQRGTSVWIGGKNYGAANTNTAPQLNYINTNLNSVIAEDPTLAKSVSFVADPATGNATLGGFGGGILTIGSGASVALPLNANVKFSGVNATGAGAALLGANSPATVLTAPYKWIRVLASDDTVCFLPIWK